MKYAIMSDVHANPAALKTALRDAQEQGCEKFLLLGDITGYGYDVRGALKIARAAFDVVLMGNHDSACADLEPAWEAIMISNYDLDREQRRTLSKDELDWLRALPATYTLNDAAFVHADFTNPKAWRYILSIEDAKRNFRSCPARLMFCGHTHLAAIWERTPEGKFRPQNEEFFCTPFVKPEGITFTPEKDGRYIINVGSVGYPRNDFCATYALWDTTTDEVCIRRLPFDFKGYSTNLLANSVAIPHWLEPMLGRAESLPPCVF